jgi:macrolide transport system ATP-binding/permease protein
MNTAAGAAKQRLPMAKSLSFHEVSFTYDTLADELFAALNVQFHEGWTGIVGANGSGKSTLLQLAAGMLQPTAGSIHRSGAVVYCPQRTDEPPEGLGEFLKADDPSARELQGRLEIRQDYLPRWSTLSHGERKRAQIAAALWRRPAVLAVDEPSNHIDLAAKELLVQRLRAFDGVGLLVSHDRDMLDSLCNSCLFIDPPTIAIRPGNYTSAAAQHEADIRRLRDLRDQAGRQVRQLRQEMAKRRQSAAKEHKVRSKRGLAIKDHDSREKINRARVADSKSGAGLRQLKGRMQQAWDKLSALTAKNESPTGIFLPQDTSRRDFLFRIASGTLALGRNERGSDRMLEFADLSMAPADRIALTGPNGAGKSTLIAHILGRLALPPDKVLYMPQEIPADQAAAILDQARRLEHERLGWAMNIISRLGSDPQRVLATESPSPGEIRKLMLAMGISSNVHMIIMDEPTNHLDLPSIRCLEEALEPCPMGLLLVSHDMTFLRKLTTVRWDIQTDADGERTSLQVCDWRSQAG